ncbi:PF11450 family protein [Burkholderia multivorans CF2]|nr:PF11450 family protein [Burkholderia multivorans CF2]
MTTRAAEPIARRCGGAREPTERTMPAKSQAQQRAAGAALSAKRGRTKMQDLKPPSKSMAKSMSEKELEKMASTPTHGKPRHKHDS